MSEAYNRLLDAAIEHVRRLKARGQRYLAVSPAANIALVTPGGSTPARVRAPVSQHRAAIGQPVRPPTTTRAVPATQAVTAPAVSNPVASRPTINSKVIAPQSKVPNELNKEQAFAALRERVLACVKCGHLVAARKNVVFGVGSVNARLMFVGEAPGADEDEQGEPFVGKAGQLLTKIIQTMGLTRETVYIANILKCRPDTPGQSAGNRKPTGEEMQVCIPFLHEQIDLIAPEVIVALGATAVEGLLGKTAGITRLRGSWQTYRNIPLMPTYHPAYLLRNQALTEKRKVWEDMLQVMSRLALPISEKQRNYFLKA